MRMNRRLLARTELCVENPDGFIPQEDRVMGAADIASKGCMV